MMKGCSTMAIKHSEISDKKLHPKLKSRAIEFGGYMKKKIYGTLTCSSGKRMRRESRIFFTDEVEALCMGYRPCGKCMGAKYTEWKAKQRAR